MHATPSHPPSVLFFSSPTCPFCPALKQHFEQLKAQGVIGELTLADATSERAATLGVRSVPWYRIGDLEFEGQRGLAELRRWAERAASADGMRDYFLEMLITGQRGQVERLIRACPARAALLSDLLAQPASSMALRLGVGAILEEFQSTALAASMVPGLVAMLQRGPANDRADMAHYLSLIDHAEARAALQACVDDADPAVREIAQEAGA